MIVVILNFSLVSLDLSLLSHQDQLDLWASSVIPVLIKNCSISAGIISISFFEEKFLKALCRLMSLITPAVADHFVKECIDVMIDNLYVDSQHCYLRTMMESMPINHTNGTLIKRKIEAILDSYNLPSTSGTLVFESIDLVKDIERFHRDMEIVSILLKY